MEKKKSKKLTHAEFQAQREYDLSQVESFVQRLQFQSDTCISELAHYFIADEAQLSAEIQSLKRLIGGIIDEAKSRKKFHEDLYTERPPYHVVTLDIHADGVLNSVCTYPIYSLDQSNALVFLANAHNATDKYPTTRLVKVITSEDFLSLIESAKEAE